MDIDKYRQEIDRIDETMIRLLNERAEAAQKIGEIKKANHLPIYVPEREKAILEKIKALNSGKMPTPVIQQIFKQIISYTRSLEHLLKIAFLGPEGSYTHQASVNFFGASIEGMSCSTIKDVFTEVDKENADYGLVPIENSYHGAVFQTLDSLIDYDLKIIGEVVLRIRHHLLSKAKNLSGIKRIYSHSQSFGQCRVFLDSYLPGVERIEVNSNSRAAQMAAADPESAAIAGALAGEIYELPALVSGIEDASDNSTRFVVLGRAYAGPSERSRTTIIVSIADRPGVLQKILKAFADRKINLTKIESRPSKRKAWDYIFFMDFEGYKDEPQVKEALEELKDIALFIKILGSYPFEGSV